MKIKLIMIVFLLLYLGAMWVIGLKSRKYASTFQSSILAGGSTTLPLLIGSYVGTHIGSGFVVGGAEYGAAYGIGGAWYGLGCGLSYICFGLLMVKFVYRRGYISLSDYFSERYKKQANQLVYIGSNLLGGISMFAGQLLAGKAIFHIVGIDGTLGLIVTAVISLVYATVSGLWGAMATAMLQSIIILAGVLAGAAMLFSANGIDMLQAALPPALTWFPLEPRRWLCSRCLRSCQP